MRFEQGLGPGLEQLADVLNRSPVVVALTGAGISVPSGIPDFRSPGTGLWENVDPMEVAHIDVFRRDPARFWHFYGARFASLESCEPNPAHHALVALERAGRLQAVITQNIDMLHRRAGTEELIEVHGSIAGCTCQVCRFHAPLQDVRARQRADEQGVPRCQCGEPLKPDVVLFGEYLPADAVERAQSLCAQADLLLCIGSSLEVYPVGGFPLITHEAGGKIAIITQGPTPLDGLATVRLSGDVAEELSALARLVCGDGGARHVSAAPAPARHP